MKSDIIYFCTGRGETGSHGGVLDPEAEWEKVFLGSEVWGLDWTGG